MIEPITSESASEQALDQQDTQNSLQAHFKPNISADEIEQVYHLKRAQPLLQVFTALFHGGFDGVLVRQPLDDDKGSQVDLWLAPSMDWYPVRVVFKDADGDFVDQTLDKVAKK